MSLEKNARVDIDLILSQAGWTVVDYGQAKAITGGNLAIREFRLTTGTADYLLTLGGEAIGVVEAKQSGTPLSGVKEQSSLYQAGEPLGMTGIRFPRRPLPFSYEATDVEIFFTNDLEPEARSRRVFCFHRPETLAAWVRKASVGVPNKQNNLLRSLLRNMPGLQREGLRTCQFQAITNLEESFAKNLPRSLVQMATGSGKTYMAVSSIYRLIKHAKARRILFLVDRSNLAVQTLNQFQQYVTPDDGRKFTELYNVQHLAGNRFDADADVYITTIQRLYSILAVRPLAQEKEQESLFETEGQEEPPREVIYNAALPIEYFDVIFIDECHRSIYTSWRPVLEYFDTFLVGLTATPENRAFAFFNRNLVYQYSQAQSVADGVNVDYEVYRLRTKITEEGSRVERDNMLYFRNKQTRERTYEKLEDDLIYEAKHLDHDVMSIDQIRTAIKEYKEALFTDLFPGRSVVPKTLIFAKHDDHADDIVQIVREEFGKGNDFAKKITYSVSGVNPLALIKEFRVSYYPRIAVSVDMISTGTDIKPLEALLFMRPIKSRTLWEQMRGRGCRMIDDAEFHAVTPDGTKSRYIIFDAVGVTRGLKSDNPPLERKPRMSLEELMRLVANGDYDDANMLSLAGRLARLGKYVTDNDKETLAGLAGGTLADLGEGLIKALDYDEQIERARAISGKENPSEDLIEEAALRLAQEATQAFKSQEVRDLILDLQRRDKQAIDDLSKDVVIEKGFEEDQALREIANFRELMEQNKEQIERFELAFQSPPGTSISEGIQSVARAVTIPTMGLNYNGIERVWRAYQKLERVRVRGAGTRRLMTDIIALIRYTMQRKTDENALLEPFQETVNQRFDKWYAEQERLRKQPFMPLQRWWLEQIRDRIAVNLQCEESDFNRAPLNKQGDIRSAYNAFGGKEQLENILRDLNERLVA